MAVFISSIIKSVHDNGWGMFTTYLKYKLEDMGKQLLKIDKFFASLQVRKFAMYAVIKIPIQKTIHWTMGMSKLQITSQ